MTQKISFDAARQSQFSPIAQRIAGDMGGRVSADSIIDLFAAVESRISPKVLNLCFIVRWCR
ncbi:hypothetical protein D4T62_10610 [Salmonella enterica subsp. enterica]|nr:hypothetical protein [Salmonella enterica subsp. enterica]EDR3673590.1 hypothetical protein [Salmonella enterica subsp. arizonae serovar 40:z4,z24:]